MKRILIAILAAFILSGIGLLSYRLIGGKPLGLRRLPGFVLNLTKAVVNSKDVTRYNRGEYTNIVFLHHSTGDKLIEQGGVRKRLAEAGYSFWDQGYNAQGLRNPQGNFTGFGYNIPQDNTDPDGLFNIFHQNVYELPLNTFSGLLQHEVIIFKSCFVPTSKISDDAQVERYKAWYLGIRDIVDQHPEKIFILVTQPPLNPAETNTLEARRARNLAQWLNSDEYLAGHNNFYTFDLFDSLAEEDSSSPDYNMLRQEYRRGADSHPDRNANETVGPLFTDFIIQSINSYRSLEGIEVRFKVSTNYIQAQVLD